MPREVSWVISRASNDTSSSVLPPTQAGYAEFLRLGPASGLKFTELEDAAVFWWNRGIPRNLLSAARGTQASEEETPPQSRSAPPPAPPSARAARTALVESPQEPHASQEPEAPQGPQEPRRREASTPAPSVRVPSAATAVAMSTSAPSVRVPPPVRVPSPASAVERPMGMYQKLPMAGGVWGVRLQGQRPQPGERVKVQTRKGKIKTEAVAQIVVEGLDYFLCTIVESSTVAA